MKVLLHTGNLKECEKSGVGQVIKHQMRALDLAHVEYTTDINDNFDIAHINTVFPESLRLAKKIKQKGIKIIYHAHTTEEDFRNSFKLSNEVAPLLKKWLIACYKTSDLILTPTEYSKGLLENYNLEREIVPISNGIDINAYQRKDYIKSDFRKTYGYKENDKVIMAVGLYIERKGILEFLELARRCPEYKFIWFGYLKPSLVPIKIKEAMKNKTDNVTFAGFVDSEKLKEAYAGCDVYIFPTKEETEGMVLLEALAMKTKTIISDIPIYDNWLLDGVNIYKAKTVDEFESKIKGILNNELEDLTEEGYKVANDRDLKQIGYKLKKIYEYVLEKDLVK